jgi:hypothetical protein
VVRDAGIALEHKLVAIALWAQHCNDLPLVWLHRESLSVDDEGVARLGDHSQQGFAAYYIRGGPIWGQNCSFVLVLVLLGFLQLVVAVESGQIAITGRPTASAPSS